MRVRRTGTVELLPPKEPDHERAKKLKVERDRRYRLNNKEIIRARKREYERLPEQVAKKAEYHKANRDRINKRIRDWYGNNAEKKAVNVRTRRARLANVQSESYTVQDVLNLYGYDCHLCFSAIDLDAPRHPGDLGWELGLHIDHLIPIVKNGPNTLENVRPAHGLCNLRKGIRS